MFPNSWVRGFLTIAPSSCRAGIGKDRQQPAAASLTMDAIRAEETPCPDMSAINQQPDLALIGNGVVIQIAWYSATLSLCQRHDLPQ